MLYFDAYFFSPFSPTTVKEGRNRSLLIQFLLTEIFQSISFYRKKSALENIYSSLGSFYPLDQFSKTGTLNRLSEHCDLLKFAFPENKQAISLFRHTLLNAIALISQHNEHPILTKKLEEELLNYLKELFHNLHPLIGLCKKDENLIFFLLKHQKEISHLSNSMYLHSFLSQLFPDGLESLCNTLCDRFHKRGFASLIPEVKSLLTKLQKQHEARV